MPSMEVGARRSSSREAARSTSLTTACGKESSTARPFTDVVASTARDSQTSLDTASTGKTR